MDGPTRLGGFLTRAVVADTGRVKHPDLACLAIPNSINTLKNGSLSVTFHIGYEEADSAFAALHPLLQREVALDIYKTEDD